MANAWGARRLQQASVNGTHNIRWYSSLYVQEAPAAVGRNPGNLLYPTYPKLPSDWYSRVWYVLDSSPLAPVPSFQSNTADAIRHDRDDTQGKESSQSDTDLAKFAESTASTVAVVVTDGPVIPTIRW